MSTAKFHEDGDDFDYHQRSIRNMREINGPRPSPLKINKDSHAIQKSSNSLPLAHNKQQKQPVIIYAHSPKVIHTQPKDFMALVQKLTGLSAADHETAPPTTAQAMKKPKQKTSRDDHDHDHDHDINDSSNSEAPTNPFLVDMPLFTPTDNFFICSPTPMFSPSFIQFMKGLPEC